MENGFPTVTAACRKHGIDPVTEMIPVAPGAHYSCGGILADLDGRTSLAGLYAAGEAASTGVQGANRLASNSVTEAIIAGRRAGAAVADALSRAGWSLGALGQDGGRPRGMRGQREGRPWSAATSPTGTRSRRPCPGTRGSCGTPTGWRGSGGHRGNGRPLLARAGHGARRRRRAREPRP